MTKISSLTGRMLLLILPAVIAALAVLAALSIARATQHETDAVHDGLRNTTRAEAADVNTEVERQLAVASGAAAVGDVPAVARNPNGKITPLPGQKFDPKAPIVQAPTVGEPIVYQGDPKGTFLVPVREHGRAIGYVPTGGPLKTVFAGVRRIKVLDHGFGFAVSAKGMLVSSPDAKLNGKATLAKLASSPSTTPRSTESPRRSPTARAGSSRRPTRSPARSPC